MIDPLDRYVAHSRYSRSLNRRDCFGALLYLHDCRHDVRRHIREAKCVDIRHIKTRWARSGRVRSDRHVDALATPAAEMSNKKRETTTRTTTARPLSQSGVGPVKRAAQSDCAVCFVLFSPSITLVHRVKVFRSVPQRSSPAARTRSGNEKRTSLGTQLILTASTRWHAAHSEGGRRSGTGWNDGVLLGCGGDSGRAIGSRVRLLPAARHPAGRRAGHAPPRAARRLLLRRHPHARWRALAAGRAAPRGGSPRSAGARRPRGR